MHKKPKDFSGPWNFGTERNTITNVLEIVREIINFWGSGKVKFKKNVKYYEQTNLQLNIDKAKKFLKWKPKYSIKKSIQVTTEWYKKVLTNNVEAEKITIEQINDYMNES
jgi:CDP-glucose 4,6-dehydratase